ncbi:MAG: hypothetical protein M0C28_28820 [Candidatus Moduliflexus flocculans]|nr:hypothetical protein [Candidatus Moduliflexus flocculans]
MRGSSRLVDFIQPAAHPGRPALPAPPRRHARRAQAWFRRKKQLLPVVLGLLER